MGSKNHPETQPEKTFEVNGEKRGVVFDFNALCIIEEQFNCNIQDMAEVLVNPDMRSLRKLYLAGMEAWRIKHNPDRAEYSLNDVGISISEVGMAEAMITVTEAIRASFAHLLGKDLSEVDPTKVEAVLALLKGENAAKQESENSTSSQSDVESTQENSGS